MAVKRPQGMAAFTIVWCGQFFSFMGSAMTTFALTIWAFKLTGSATALALVGFFNFGPTVLFSPIAGALVDRWNRKLTMMLSDIGTGLSTLVILILYLTGNLQIWHIYVTGAFAGIFQAFQFPAYSAAITTMIPKEQFARASGMISLAEWGSGIFAPVLAGMLIGIIDVSGILAIDLVTLSLAILALVIVIIPQPRQTEEGRLGKGSLWKESGYGFRYIFARPSLLGLQLVFFSANLAGTLSNSLINPMILSRTGNNASILAGVQSAGAAGGAIGSLLLTAWGGPKRRVLGMMASLALTGMFFQVLMGIGGALPFWMAAAFMGFFLGPIINGLNQAIWQSKVAPDVQGRVFSARRLISQLTAPLGMLLAGPLADNLMEPAMKGSNLISASLGPLFGRTAGSGMSVIIAFTGLMLILVAVVAYSVRSIRDVEVLLPDHTPVGETELEKSQTPV